MASPDEVRRYLAYWFQLGKKLVIDNQEFLLPRPVLWGDRYSPEFETCWQRAIAHDGQNAHLEGTNQTIAELLGSSWTISPCARCEMPVPMLDLGSREPTCPCADLTFWPDTECPQPREPINTYDQLSQIRDRLLKVSEQSKSSDQSRAS
ncbi:hypothetical protein H6G89_29620 [Oscillatoria sp. FACHB-1407]|uniref:hypothetical protein n=1 Tax=Oscillatoria sp. FACHB-1407 TaxID=2692847 RepID=UPI001687C41A|nr:hypothetical protein [Oscillatoria sp. FACHB-1407]MBD2465171.1 hypothetical protein [Oscillatoria sp. FACHB-1407]